MADCIYNLRKIYLKKSCSKVVKFTGKRRIPLKMIFRSGAFFVIVLVLEILMYESIQNHPGPWGGAPGGGCGGEATHNNEGFRGAEPT